MANPEMTVREAEMCAVIRIELDRQEVCVWSPGDGVEIGIDDHVNLLGVVRAISQYIEKRERGAT